MTDIPMTDIKVTEGNYDIRGAKFGILASRFNSFIVENLKQGAIDTLLRHGANRKDLHIVYVPGAFEMPLAAKLMAAKRCYDAIIALGTVIRGGTPHFEYIAGECTKGLASVSLQFDVPIAFGVLTVDTIEQAIERAGTKAGNKGVDAAMSAIEMVNLLRQLQ